MTSRDFCYWLQGFFELSSNPNGSELPDGKIPETTSSITTKQADCIRRHLAMVFKHEIDPSMGDEKHRKQLDALHDTGGALDILMPKMPKINC